MICSLSVVDGVWFAGRPFTSQDNNSVDAAQGSTERTTE